MEFGKIPVGLRNPNAKTGKTVVAGAAALTAFALWASGCGTSHDNGNGRHPAASGGGKPELIFDDLGGGSSVIEVFPDPGKGRYDGTFYSGDKVTAMCKTAGQERHSDPGVGEEKRQSDEWILIEGTPGERQYATAVYIEHPQQLLGELPEC